MLKLKHWIKFPNAAFTALSSVETVDYVEYVELNRPDKSWNKRPPEKLEPLKDRLFPPSVGMSLFRKF
jgi:hypothetical protein